MKELSKLTKEQKNDHVYVSVTDYKGKIEKTTINVIPRILSRQLILESCFDKKDYQVYCKNNYYSREYILNDDNNENIDIFCRYDLKALMEYPETAKLVTQVIEEHNIKTDEHNYYLIDNFVTGKIFKSGKVFKAWNKNND